MTELPPATDVAANRATWVAALRSGDYAQARGALRVDAGYCCLGVAEDVRGVRWLTPIEFADEHDLVDVAEHDLSVVDGVVVAATGEVNEAALAALEVAGVTLGDGTHVACDPAGDDAVPAVHDPHDRAYGNPATTTLSDRTRAWLGLSEDNPNVCYRGNNTEDGPYVVTSLVDLNDDDRLTLAEVAAVVADQPPDWTGAYEAAYVDAASRNAALTRAAEAVADAQREID